MRIDNMSNSPRLLWIIAIAILTQMLGISPAAFDPVQCPFPPAEEPLLNFVQETERFWAYDAHSKIWKKLELPFDLLSCIDDNCSKVGSIGNNNKKQIKEVNGDTDNNYDSIIEDKQVEALVMRDDDDWEGEEGPIPLPVRTRMSLSRVSDASVWITGESGSIYERYWNGMHWVIAPHDLPLAAGPATSVFMVNQTIMALSEAGILYKLEVDANGEPLWVEIGLSSLSNIDTLDENSSLNIHLRSGIPSADQTALYFATVDGSLVELSELNPLRWINHGRPRGGDVAAVADAGTMRSEVIFTVSTIGELYEFDKNSRPPWKKHIWGKSLMANISLAASRGCNLHGLIGAHSTSLFLLSKDGFLVERQLYQRKWSWLIHPMPKGLSFGALGPSSINETHGTKIFSLFLTTTTGFAYEYQIPILPGATRTNVLSATWIKHKQPLHAKIAKSIPGIFLQTGRILFALDDGRLGELHLSGAGGESVGPSSHTILRRKALANYEWSILDAPESEGGNAGYCTESRGPLNCVEAVKNTPGQEDSTVSGVLSRVRKRKGHVHQRHTTSQKIHKHVLHAETGSKYPSTNNFDLFCIRTIQADKSFFLVTESGLAFEHLHSENTWLWLKHDHISPIQGIFGVYNGSLFVVDIYGNLFIRERNSNGLIWINCSAMEGGRQVALGPPWDGVPGPVHKVTVEDSLFFVSKNGSLLRLIVALRRFVWQDCGKPHNVQVAFILDQEILRYNVVFVVANNGHLYQYNRVTSLWYKHEQTPHLVLSRLPGVVVRQSFLSMSGSLFMRSEDGGLVEFHWHSVDGWSWTVHGTPEKDVVLSTAPGPSFDGNQLFVIGSNGQIYSRYLDDKTWKWKGFGWPLPETISHFPKEFTNDIGKVEQNIQRGYKGNVQDSMDDGKGCPTPDAAGCLDMELQHIYLMDIDCDEKVAPVRPIPFSKDSVIFMLRDGRLAELRKMGDANWKWVRVMSTPISRCKSSYLTAIAS